MLNNIGKVNFSSFVFVFVAYSAMPYDYFLTVLLTWSQFRWSWLQPWMLDVCFASFVCVSEPTHCFALQPKCWLGCSSFFAASLDIHFIAICQSNASPPLERSRAVRDKNVHIQIDNSCRNATAFILASFPLHGGSFRLRLISTAIIESNQVNKCLIGNVLLRAV